ASHGSIQIIGGSQVTVTNPNQLFGTLSVYGTPGALPTELEVDITSNTIVDETVTDTLFSHELSLLQQAREAIAQQKQHGTVIPEDVTRGAGGAGGPYVIDARPEESDPLLQFARGVIQPIQVDPINVELTINDPTGAANRFIVDDTPGAGATIHTAR